MSATEIDWSATGAMIGGISSAITALIAVVAALYASRQISENRRLNAEDAYLDFHRMSFDNPQYAEPDFKKIKSDRESYIKYHWFVIGMLMCVERIITILPKDLEWRAAVTDDLDTHVDYLSSEDFRTTLSNFSRPMQAFVNDFLAAKGAAG